MGSDDLSDLFFYILLTTGLILLTLEAKIKRSSEIKYIQSASSRIGVPAKPEAHKTAPCKSIPSVNPLHVSNLEQPWKTSDLSHDTAHNVQMCGADVSICNDELDGENLVDECGRLVMENNAYRHQITQLQSDVQQLNKENSDLLELLSVIESQLRDQQSQEATLSAANSDRHSAVDELDYQPPSSTSLTVTERYPSSLFHIVCVGDSGVGKTSFIKRMCTRQDFKPTFSTTIGVDFVIKKLVVDQHAVTLQVWDTAGQERYRCLTQQYFRRADGVIIMYDVTSESSFRNLHYWLDSAQTSVASGTILVLVGNKKDLVVDSSDRVIRELDGFLLAKEFNVSIFNEVSAISGTGVMKIVEDLTRHLLVRQRASSIDMRVVDLAAQRKAVGNLDSSYSCCFKKPARFFKNKNEDSKS